MPTNKNAETRYKILDKHLANHYRHLTTEDLMDLVNAELGELGMRPVCKRTIEMDLKYLEDGPFHAEIEHYLLDEESQNSKIPVKRRCHRYADKSFSIFKKKMTDDEKYLLSEAFSLLGQFDGLPNLEALESLRASLEMKSDRRIVSFAKNPLENSSLFGQLFTAITQRQVIEIHYHRFDNPDEDRTRTVHPYLLKEYNRRWYLIAADKEDGKLLTFGLDRIDYFVDRPGIIYHPYNGDLAERYEDIIGVTLYEDQPVQTIVFWVSDYSKDYVATKPLHESQRNISGERAEKLRQQFPTLTGGRFFSIDCIENYELIRELTSFGAELIVLSPDPIKEKVRERINVMQDRYSDII